MSIINLLLETRKRLTPFCVSIDPEGQKKKPIYEETFEVGLWDSDSDGVIVVNVVIVHWGTIGSWFIPSTTSFIL